MDRKNLWLGLGLATGTALVMATLALANKHVDDWETLTLDDAQDGDFVTLSDGARMHYVARGAHGPALILVHGLMDSTSNWHKNIDALAQNHRVWAIDLIGFGFSSRVIEPKYSLKYLAQVVHEFMDARGIARAALVGHSLGGAVALEFAHDFPARVTKLILIAPGTFLVNLPPAVNALARVPFAPRALIGATMTSAPARRAAYLNAVGNPAHLDPQEYDLRVRPARVKGSVDALVAMLASPRATDLFTEMATIQTPTLILWGDKDRAVPLEHSERHNRQLPHARMVILKGAGHIPQNEYPARVNQLMLDFLDGVEETSATNGA